MLQLCDVITSMKLKLPKMKSLFLLLALCCTIDLTAQEEMNKGKQNFVLVIHGGAGTITKQNMTAQSERAYKESLEKALQAGYKILNNGGSSLDAVEAVVKILEDNPLFNAGKGAV